MSNIATAYNKSTQSHPSSYLSDTDTDVLKLIFSFVSWIQERAFISFLWQLYKIFQLSKGKWPSTLLAEIWNLIHSILTDYLSWHIIFIHCISLGMTQVSDPCFGSPTSCVAQDTSIRSEMELQGMHYQWMGSQIPILLQYT